MGGRPILKLEPANMVMKAVSMMEKVEANMVVRAVSMMEKAVSMTEKAESRHEALTIQTVLHAMP